MSWYYSKSGFDQDAQDYFDRIVAAGSTIDATAQSAITAFVSGCKSDSIWSLLLDVGPVCGSDFAAALIKLKKLSSGWSYSNVGGAFVNGDYTQATGLTGNGTNKMLGSGVFPDIDLSIGDTGIGVYCRGTANGSIDLHGCANTPSSGQTLTLYTTYSDNKIYSDHNSEATQIGGSAITGQAIGFVFGTRTTAPTTSLYRNGSQIANSGTVGGSLPDQELYFMARNRPGASEFRANHPYSFFCITSGMDSTQAAALNTRVQALQTALGRNV